MQNHPPLNDEPDGTLSSAQNGQNDPTLENASHTYIEPQYQEYAQPANAAQPAPAPTMLSNPPGTHTQAAGQPVPFPASAPPVSQPGYVPPAIPPGYVQQPGYPPQPGYIPATPQLGYIPQPGYIPTTPQPGYMPPMPPPLAPRPRKSNWLAITGAVLAVIVVLAVVVSAISLSRQGGPSPTATATPQGTHAPSSGQIGQPTSAFQAASCPFQVGTGIVEGQQLTCGYVTVPEDRNVKNGPSVKLAVAIFKAPQYMNSVDPAPVLRLDGGPGGPSLDGWAKYVSAANYNSLISNHDVVMFDQRGTGYSTPSLKCPELIALQDTSAVGSQQTYEQ
ncbi:MAG TPA: hypothetical protein VH164_11680, partial [Ktedonobacteraceae bacterium]|nr:hypothetical protein [Ktedonobacteraceae bacterium]